MRKLRWQATSVSTHACLVPVRCTIEEQLTFGATGGVKCARQARLRSRMHVWPVALGNSTMAFRIRATIVLRIRMRIVPARRRAPPALRAKGH